MTFTPYTPYPRTSGAGNRAGTAPPTTPAARCVLTSSAFPDLRRSHDPLSPTLHDCPRSSDRPFPAHSARHPAHARSRSRDPTGSAGVLPGGGDLDDLSRRTPLAAGGRCGWCAESGHRRRGAVRRGRGLRPPGGTGGAVRRRTDWRTRLRAGAALLDHLLCHADSVISAALDIRPLRHTFADAAAWLGRTWRAYLHRAHVRKYGPGRGLIAVVLNHPKTTTEKETHG